MSTKLESVLQELGFAHYLNSFVDQGFDSWDTIQDIQESDLDALGVKLGHRRKLQRRIASARGIAPSISLISAMKLDSDNFKQHLERESSTRSESSLTANGVTKRKYRRHPKPDENAPKRPSSAYVLFANRTREDLRNHNLLFTEISKLVGQSWQSLNRNERALYENQANAAKHKYRQSLAEYKKTPEHGRYRQYLQEFKERLSSHNHSPKAHLFGTSLSQHVAKKSIIDPRLATKDPESKTIDSEHELELLLHNNSHGSITSYSANNTLSGKAFRAASENSIGKMRESQLLPCTRHPIESTVSTTELNLLSTSSAAMLRKNSLDENGLWSRNSNFGSNSSIHGPHSKYFAKSSKSLTPPRSCEMSSPLLSLSKMLNKDNHHYVSDRSPSTDLHPINLGSPMSFPRDDSLGCNERLALSEPWPAGDNALSIYTPVNNQTKLSTVYAKTRQRGPSMPTSKNQVETYYGPSGYRFLSNSPPFRHIKSKRFSASIAVNKGDWDGLGALVQASKIIDCRNNHL